MAEVVVLLHAYIQYAYSLHLNCCDSFSCHTANVTHYVQDCSPANLTVDHSARQKFCMKKKKKLSSLEIAINRKYFNSFTIWEVILGKASFF